MQKSVFVIIPNYNGADMLAASVDSVLKQSFRNFTLVIVDNGSIDDSRTIIERYAAKDDRVRGIFRDNNYGYTGGVNPGLELAIAEKADYAAAFNNDAVADKNWLKHLVEYLNKHDEFGVAACDLLHTDGKTYDSTGDQYTSWGIPYPRGRGEKISNRYKDQLLIFGASGGASLYRVKMLEQIGIFDQDFFAYYEDIDLSFRAQLAGWKVAYVPASIVYHGIGMTSGAMYSGFTTYQYFKNLPWVIIKDVPLDLWPRIVPRFLLAYSLFFVNSILHGQGGSAFKGWVVSWWRLPKKLAERRHIQKQRVVSSAYIWSLFLHDLPPNAHKLRKLRSLYRKLMGKVQTKDA